MMNSVPSLLKYSGEHVWVKSLGDKKYRVGITDFAQNELGDIVYVDLPGINQEYAQSKKCALIESVKSASEIYCPISGKIMDINSDLKNAPEIINNDPYNKGWIFIIQSTDDIGLKQLIHADEYIALTKER